MDKDGTTRARILVVDDDEVMRELLPVLLGLRPDEIQVAHSGDEAVAWLEGSRCPDVILTDLQMPGLERDDLVAALRAATSAQTLLLGMSGSQPPPTTARLLDAFVLKPFGATELEHAIGRARRAREAQTHPPQKSSTPPPAPEAAAGHAPVLDEAIFSALAKRFKPEHLVEVYTLTLDDVATRHKRIEGFAAAGDLEAVQREAHSIKGACGMVGARELQQLAAAAEGGTTVNTSVIADFPAACARLQRMLDAKFQI